MACRKIAISLPEEVTAAVDRAAAARKTTRSGFIAKVLYLAARAKSDQEITERINDVIREDPQLQVKQRKDAEVFLAHSSLMDERW